MLLCVVRNTVFVYVLKSKLTPETTPASHVAGGVMTQDFAGFGKASGLDGTAQGSRAGQLDEGNVVAGTLKKKSTFRCGETQKEVTWGRIKKNLPDPVRIPVLVDNDPLGADGHGARLAAGQVVLTKVDSVGATAAWPWTQRERKVRVASTRPTFPKTLLLLVSSTYTLHKKICILVLYPMQWAAVRTHWLEIRMAPQVW